MWIDKVLLIDILTFPSVSLYWPFLVFPFSHCSTHWPLWSGCKNVCAPPCAHTCVCACAHVWAIWFFSLYACEADVKACAFSLLCLLSSTPAKVWAGWEWKGSRRRRKFPPQLIWPLWGEGTLYPLMVWTHGWNPSDALGRKLIQDLLWPRGTG